MKKSMTSKNVLFITLLMFCFSGYADRSLKTPLKLKFAIGGHAVSTTTLETKFLIHHEENSTSSQETQQRTQSSKNEMERVYIHIEGEVVPVRHRRNTYKIYVQGKAEMGFTSGKSTTLFANQANVPETPGIKSEHEKREMEIRTSTRMKAGQKKTLASKDSFDLELRIEEDTD